jgi:hypothetical protein
VEWRFEVFMAVPMKNGVLWALVRTDVSGELSASFIRVTRIGIGISSGRTRPWGLLSL